MPACSTRRHFPFAALLALLLLQGCASFAPAPGAGEQGASAAGTQATAMIPPATNVPPEAKALFDKAHQAMRTDKPAGAIPLLEQLTKSWPQYASPFTDLGIAYRKTGKDDKALAAFAEAIRLQPADCRPRVETGILLRRRHQFSAAERAYRDCLDRNPDYKPALLNLGILYEIYMGKWQEALTAYQHYQSLRTTPDKRVAGWIAALSRRLEHENSLAQRGTTK